MERYSIKTKTEHSAKKTSTPEIIIAKNDTAQHITVKSKANNMSDAMIILLWYFLYGDNYGQWLKINIESIADYTVSIDMLIF